MIVHAEDGHAVKPARGRRYADFLASRPKQRRTRPSTRVIDLAKRTRRPRAHPAPVLRGRRADRRQAKADGVAITAETCRTNLTFIAEEIPDGATQFSAARHPRGPQPRGSLAGAGRRHHSTTW